MKILSKLVGALMLTSAVAGTAMAQTSRVHLGPRLSYHLDAEELGIGAQLSLPIASHLELYPSFDYFLVSAGSWVNFNADLKLRFAGDTFNWLYVGGGINVARVSFGPASNTQTGLNLFFGAESLKGRVHPFGELRFVSNNGTSAQIAGGLNFTLQSH